MYKAKTPKLLISALAIFGLIFGGSLVSVAPATAATSVQGCKSSNYTPNDCKGYLASATSLIVGSRAILGSTTATSDPNINVKTTALTAVSADTSLATTCTGGTWEFTLYPTGNYVSSAAVATSAAELQGLSYSPTTGAFSAVAAQTFSATLAKKNYKFLATCSTNDSQLYYADISLEVTSGGVAAAAVPTLAPATQTVSGTVGDALASTTLSATDFGASCTVAFTISPAASNLPTGLSFSTSTGSISGTVSATKSSTDFTITATGTGTCNAPNSATATITVSVSAAPVVTPAPAPEPDRKVTICHRTHSETNPYVRITVDYNSVNKKSGHQIHDEIFAGEHVFKAGIYKRAKDKDWGDIIPADPSGLNRWKPLNWTTLGAQIYNGTVAGCPAYDAVKYYNAMREAGVPEKKIKQEMKELEDEQSEAQPSREKKDPTTLKYSGTNTKALEEENDKVTICHRTNSVTNPYVRITVSSSSIYKTKGHYGHDEIYDGNHVFDSTIDYPNNRKDWGDIIPADPTGKNRWAPLNMTALGKKIYDGTVAGCAEKTAQQLYNELREEGKSKKEIIKELEEQKSLDEDPKDLDEIKYTGNDPEVEKTEPKEPVEPSNVVIPDQSLSGIVWLDINKDGLKDPDEPLMKNIKLYVVQVSSIPTPVSPASLQSSSTLRRADVPVRSAAVKEVLTDANGFYLFASLGAGDWMVTTTIPQDLYVTYDSHESSDGSITTTVPVASHAFTWVGLVGDDEKVTLAKLTEILKENPNALPESELPAALKVLVKKAKAALAGKTSLAETGTQDLAWFYFGILLMLTGVALRFARTKQ